MFYTSFHYKFSSGRNSKKKVLSLDTKSCFVWMVRLNFSKKNVILSLFDGGLQFCRCLPRVQTQTKYKQYVKVKISSILLINGITSFEESTSGHVSNICKPKSPFQDWDLLFEQRNCVEMKVEF